jgi:hypothetical protein
VTLLGISVYGAMRVEAISQQKYAIRISATLTKKSSKAVVLTTHVTAARLLGEDYIGVSVYGLPKGSDVSLCKKDKACNETPCLSQELQDKCQLIYGAVVPADTNGRVNYTLSDGLVPDSYQDITVQAKKCKKLYGCPRREVQSFLDLHLTKPPANPSPSPKATQSH